MNANEFDVCDSNTSDVISLVFSGQPDVVVNSIQQSRKQTVDLHLLHCMQKQCSETKRELERTRCLRKYYATALEAMVVVVNYLTGQLEVTVVDW